MYTFYGPLNTFNLILQTLIYSINYLVDLVSRNDWANREVMASSTDNNGPSEPSPSTSSSNNEKSNSYGSDANFECNICLDTAKDAVVSMCGHLFWYVFTHITIWWDFSIFVILKKDKTVLKDFLNFCLIWN